MKAIRYILSIFKKKPKVELAVCGKPITKAKECSDLYGEDCCMYNKINQTN